MSGKLSEKKIRVRFSPSPSGVLHIGGVRTALFNYLLSKKLGGDFYIRIEDTDRERFVPTAEKYIYDSLEWLGIMPDESPKHGGQFGPYTQSQRTEIYKKHVQILLDKGYAYYAFDTPDELEKMREDFGGKSRSAKYDSVTRQYMKNSLVLSESETKRLLEEKHPYCIRLLMPKNRDIVFTDMIRGKVKFNTSECDDKVIWKSKDNLPTYHLANVVDDHLMNTTHVIRGEEWLSSVPTHIMLYESFGWEHPTFAHLPLILRPEGNGKLSKRDGDAFGIPVYPLQFKEMGFLPEAVNNFLAFLGWNPGGNRELYTIDELIQSFSIERVSKSGARYNFKKALWYNNQYIKVMDNNLALEQLVNDKGEKLYELYGKELVEKMWDLTKDKVMSFKDITLKEGEKEKFYPSFYSLTKWFWNGIDLNQLNPESFKNWGETQDKWFSDYISYLKENKPTDLDGFQLKGLELITQLECKQSDVLIYLRQALTLGQPSPGLFELMVLWGVDETLNRLEGYYNFVQEILKIN
jgi:glutamyl-tRNA synthetase